MPTPSSLTKRRLRYFVSYAHSDGDLPGKLLLELDKHFGACRHFEFLRWQDTHLLLGEQWHQEIQQAATECDFGLLLVSPSFLRSSYIGEFELPLFTTGERLCMPVGLCRLDLKNHDLKGLEDSQIFLHSTPRCKTRRSFAECAKATAADFALTLYNQIVERLQKGFAAGAVKASTAAPPPPLSKITNNLPRQSSFFGRQRELEVIGKALLPQTRTWGVLLDGPGGMGKTSLAVHAADLAAKAGLFDQVLFITTKSHRLTSDGTVAVSASIVAAYPDLLNQIGLLLDLPHVTEKPVPERAALIKAALQTEKALLILDNLENLEKEQQILLFEFLQDLPQGCKAIVTSRRRSDVEARIIRLEKLEQQPALEFLQELAADRPELARATQEERLHLYAEAGGNPLLLRWIVGQLGRGSCRSIADALDLCRKAGASNDPLAFIFGDLLETFTKEETQALAALTYFTQKMDVEHIAELASLPQALTQTALGSLANRALVIPDETEENFALVPMVADFLRKTHPEVVAETGDRLEKLAYALIVENGYDKHERFPLLDTAWPSVLSAMPRLLDGPNERLQTVCNALFTYLEFKGRWDEFLVLNQRAETRALQAGDDKNAGWRAYYTGWIHYLRKQADEVLECAGRAAAHWDKAFPPDRGVRERAIAIQLRGIGHELKKDYPAAIIACREVLELDSSLSAESPDVAIDLSNLADVEQLSGDFPSAERDYRKALQVARAVGHPEGVASYTGNLARLALVRQEWPEAEALAREALQLAENVGRQELIAEGCHHLAKAVLQQGRAEEGTPHARRAVEIYTELVSPCLAEAQETRAACERAAEPAPT